MDFAAQLPAYRVRAEQGLDRLVPAATTRPARLHEAMRYALLGGGKRLRPILTLATADLFARAGAPEAQISNFKSEIADALPAAVAIECLHTYSLVHDDLPCMDDDDLRRGRPTTHRQFDEATALLAGDALLTLAFQLVGQHYAATPALCAALTREIADAAGSEKLIGGQMEDLLAEQKADATAADLEFIHLNKTAAMLTVCLVAGGLCGGATPAQLDRLRTAGRHLGLAFQIVDDILDATADTATLGKTAGKDAQAGKTTYVKLHGLETSRQLAREHTDAALAALALLPGDKTFLTALVGSLTGRTS
ncbi:Farnesyl diphosphate synthase [Lacunisphaera limnophila]|uniref:Farnesyl diphosphate synthase n=1 Tax=Lacunisphaera limnophila TaxID=1838286 RepID=A0A1D8AW91_9BACT|nr:farnesyl diphosphate synthase [Lacunisphaera limnophila]AOS45160.1 Farnesyl diphosphate synthase [Lacunisphaera limnophila]